MKRIIFGLLLPLLAIGPLDAQSTKSTLNTLTTNSFPDNTTGAITPAIMRSWAASVINSFQQFTGVNAQTGTTYTFQAGDYGQLVTFNNANPIAVTLPAPTGSFSSWNVLARSLNTGLVTITPQGGATINGAANFTLTNGTNVWIISDGNNYQVFSTAAAAAVTLVSGAGGTTITGGHSGSLLFNSSGTLSDVTTTGTSQVVLSNNPRFADSGTITVSGVTFSGNTILSGTVAMPLLTSAGVISAAICQTTTGLVIVQGGADCFPATAIAINVGGTTVTGGTNGYVLYNNSGILGNVAPTGSGNAVFSGSPTFTGSIIGPNLGTWSSAGITSTIIGATSPANAQFAIITSGVWNGAVISNSFLPAATASISGVVIPDNATLTFSGATLKCTTMTSQIVGCGKVDNSTITVNGAGTLSAIGAATSAVAVGVTSVTAGTNTYILFNNNGTLGNVAPTGSGNVVEQNNPTLGGTIGGNLGFSGTTSFGGTVTAGGIPSTGTFFGTLCENSSSNVYLQIGGDGCVTSGVVASVASSINGDIALFANASATSIKDSNIPISSVALLTTSDQVLAGGANVNSLSLSPPTTTVTIDCGNRPLQYVTAFTTSWTIAAPTSDGSCILLVTNPVASAGNLAFSGFNVGTNTGDTYTQTSSSMFMLSILRIASKSTYSWKALQ